MPKAQLVKSLQTTSYNDINAKSHGAARAGAPFTKQSGAYEPGRPPQHIHPSGCNKKRESEVLPMKLLPKKFSKKGFTFTLERRNEHVAIYRQQWNGKKDVAIAYEVIVPRMDKKRFVDGKWEESERYESYPSTKSWGDFGWTYTDLDLALARYASLSVRESCRNRFQASSASLPIPF
jgi:hypothetical protein